MEEMTKLAQPPLELFETVRRLVADPTTLKEEIRSYQLDLDVAMIQYRHLQHLELIENTLRVAEQVQRLERWLAGIAQDVGTLKAHR